MLCAHLLLMALVLGISYWWSRTALMLCFVMCMLLANIFLQEEIHLLGMHVTPVEVYTIAGIVALNLLQQKYGRSVAQKAIYLGFFALLVWVMAVCFHLAYQVSAGWQDNAMAYQRLFAPSWRIVAASIVAYLISTHAEVRLFSWCQQRFHQRFLGLRFLLTVCLVQAIDTTVFGVVGLLGLGFDLVEVMLFSYCVKCLVALGYSPFISWIQKIEQRRITWILNLKSYISPHDQTLV